MNKFAISVALSALAAMPLAQTQRAAPIDVSRDHWAFDAVDALFRLGLLSGYPVQGARAPVASAPHANAKDLRFHLNVPSLPRCNFGSRIGPKLDLPPTDQPRLKIVIPQEDDEIKAIQAAIDQLRRQMASRDLAAGTEDLKHRFAAIRVAIAEFREGIRAARRKGRS